MLSLDSPLWSKLRHAYGESSDIPALLRKLDTMPDSGREAEPWFTLWSALAHQGDVYSASFAAVPHVVAAIERTPTKATSTYFQFPAWVETCRRQKAVPIPSELEVAYAEALRKLPSLVAAASARDWDAGFLVCALSAIAASKGYASVAEAVLELTPEVATDFMEWFFGR